jgi:hypothetical protein
MAVAMAVGTEEGMEEGMGVATEEGIGVGPEEVTVGEAAEAIVATDLGAALNWAADPAQTIG